MIIEIQSAGSQATCLCSLLFCWTKQFSQHLVWTCITVCLSVQVENEKMAALSMGITVWQSSVSVKLVLSDCAIVFWQSTSERTGRSTSWQARDCGEGHCILKPYNMMGRYDAYAKMRTRFAIRLKQQLEQRILVLYDFVLLATMRRGSRMYKIQKKGDLFTTKATRADEGRKNKKCTIWLTPALPSMLDLFINLYVGPCIEHTTYEHVLCSSSEQDIHSISLDVKC